MNLQETKEIKLTNLLKNSIMKLTNLRKRENCTCFKARPEVGYGYLFELHSSV